jgi:hypothetical protein
LKSEILRGFVSPSFVEIILVFEFTSIGFVSDHKRFPPSGASYRLKVTFTVATAVEVVSAEVRVF